MSGRLAEIELLGTFFGMMDQSDSTAEMLGPVGAQAAVRMFNGGYLKYNPGISFHADDDCLCIADGEPSFTDSGDAQRAREHGAAAAWAAAIRNHRISAAERVQGRFAVVLIRPSERELIAFTDRFATFPICYSMMAGEIRFGSRADDVAGASPAVSAQSLFDYLFFHTIPAPATIYEHVRRLPAAHALEWRDGNLDCRRYWHPVFAEQSGNTVAERETEFLNLIESAVAREANSGVVGAFLSGGTDSSTIAGMLCKVTGQAAKTYSIGFDASGYDEIEYARIAARHFGTDHHEYYVTPEDLLEGIPKVACHYDQPFGNSSAVPAWVCASRASADGVDKLLAGDGGDELFGGNVRYAEQRIFERYDLIPESARRLLVDPVLKLPRVDRLPIINKAASYVRQARIPLPDRLQRYNLLLRIGCEQVFEPAFLAAVDTDAPFATQRSWWKSIEAKSYVDQMIAFDWKFTLADNDLPKVVGTADLAGIDIGFPLLSDELLDFSLKLPAKWKLKGRTLRWFFKYALRDFLPDEILRKQKHGFGLPFGVWACTHSDLKNFVCDALDNLRKRGIVQPRFLDKLSGELLPAYPGYYGELVWILMMLELWMQSHNPDWRFD